MSLKSVEPNGVLRIPQDTRHAVILQGGDQLEYCHFNAFVDTDTVRSLMP